MRHRRKPLNSREPSTASVPSRGRGTISECEGQPLMISRGDFERLRTARHPAKLHSPRSEPQQTVPTGITIPGLRVSEHGDFRFYGRQAED